MKLQQGFCKMVAALGLVLILAGVAVVPQSAWASMEDAAIFYDELKDQGEWVDYGNYGPVWYPSQVQENWRPFVDGRWTPSEEGYVFETQEPWAPSTYHYGNWMPTPEYGWVWVPGRTWYPNTVSWRTSPESAGPDASYIGWAPVPPPNYTPAPGYYPPNYSGGGSYGGSMDNLMSSPFWIFVRAASFLLGLTSPYSPSYSYWGSGALVPVQAVPYYYTRTVIVNNYFSPTYYPAGYIATGGYYNWGPPIPYVARVTRIRQATINNYMRQVNIYQRRNVVPAPGVLARHAYFRDVLPPAMLHQQPLPRGARIQAAHVARANLVRPNLVNASLMKNPPRFSATIPKAQVESGPWHRGVPGAALPASAVIRPNRQMEQHIRRIPSGQRFEPISPSARHWNVPQAPAAAAVQPKAAPGHRGPEVTSVPGPTTPGAVPFGRGPQGTPPAMTHGTPGTPQAVMPQEQRKPKECANPTSHRHSGPVSWTEAEANFSSGNPAAGQYCHPSAERAAEAIPDSTTATTAPTGAICHSASEAGAFPATTCEAGAHANAAPGASPTAGPAPTDAAATVSAAPTGAAATTASAPTGKTSTAAADASTAASATTTPGSASTPGTAKKTEQPET
jgi:hypothetical protein